MNRRAGKGAFTGPAIWTLSPTRRAHAANATVGTLRIAHST